MGSCENERGCGEGKQKYIKECHFLEANCKTEKYEPCQMHECPSQDLIQIVPIDSKSKKQTDHRYVSKYTKGQSVCSFNVKVGFYITMTTLLQNATPL